MVTERPLLLTIPTHRTLVAWTHVQFETFFPKRIVFLTQELEGVFFPYWPVIPTDPWKRLGREPATDLEETPRRRGHWQWAEQGRLFFRWGYHPALGPVLLFGLFDLHKHTCWGLPYPSVCFRSLNMCFFRSGRLLSEWGPGEPVGGGSWSWKAFHSVFLSERECPHSCHLLHLPAVVFTPTHPSRLPELETTAPAWRHCFLPLGASWENRYAFGLTSPGVEFWQGSDAIRFASVFTIHLCPNRAGRVMCYHFVKFLVGKHTGSCEFTSVIHELALVSLGPWSGGSLLPATHPPHIHRAPPKQMAMPQYLTHGKGLPAWIVWAHPLVGLHENNRNQWSHTHTRIHFVLLLSNQDLFYLP